VAIAAAGSSGLTGAFAEAAVAETQRRLNEIAGLLRASPAEAPERGAALTENQRRLERQVSDLQRKLATGGNGSAAVEDVNGVKLAARNLGEVPARELKAWRMRSASRSVAVWWHLYRQPRARRASWSASRRT
jgi:alanyl-tRNA synthetase